jgi:hypothetical protein
MKSSNHWIGALILAALLSACGGGTVAVPTSAAVGDDSAPIATAPNSPSPGVGSDTATTTTPAPAGTTAGADPTSTGASPGGTTSTGAAPGGTTSTTAITAATPATASIVSGRQTEWKASALAEEFVGPFATWVNVKTHHGAAGNGTTDDTAAFQAALNLLDEGAHPGASPAVLYVPAGTYKITGSLKIPSGRAGLALIGEDPTKTTIRWAGAQGGTMLQTLGVAFVRIGRITWDGAGLAGTAVDQDWDWRTGHYAGHWEYADNIFKDLEIGIRGGKSKGPGAETVVKRSHFYRISQAGVRIEDFNALNWLVVNSYFEDCRTGVTNDPGAGDFRVHDSMFRRSTYADVSISNTGFFGFHRNFSIGSRQFFRANGPTGAGATIVIQGNTILDPQSTAIENGNRGMLTLIDNAVRSASGHTGPAVSLFNTGDSAILSVGNKFTVANPFQTQGKLRRVDDSTVDRTTINPTLPALPEFAPRVSRTIFEVPAGASGAAIQTAINNAAASGTVRPVVHLAPGDYQVGNTITVPANSDVQIIGDDWDWGYFGSRLAWTGPAGGTVLKLAGPSRATLRSLSVIGNGRSPGTGILVENADQSGARVYGDQLEHIEMPVGARALVGEGLDNTLIQMRQLYTGVGEKTEYVPVTMIGGPRTAAGEATSARMNIYAAGFAAGPALAVQNGAKVFVQDLQYEAWVRSYLRLNSSHSGTVTIQGGKVFANSAAQNDPVNAELDVNGFNGKLSVMSQVFFDNAWVALRDVGSQGNVLLTGNSFFRSDNGYLLNQLPAGRAMALHNQKTVNNQVAVPDIGVDDAAIRTMLTHARAEKPQAVETLPAAVTDVRFYRVTVAAANNGVRITR